MKTNEIKKYIEEIIIRDYVPNAISFTKSTYDKVYAEWLQDENKLPTMELDIDGKDCSVVYVVKDKFVIYGYKK